MSGHELIEPLQEKVPICAIGCSAGGVSALQVLFKRLPVDLGLAYVVVLHLPSNQPSILHELLASVNGMPACQVHEAEELNQNHVYVISPGRELLIEGGLVRTGPGSENGKLRNPIDRLFRSIAADRGDGLAVVMTGAGQDGSHGVRAIKEGGGIVLVQDPAEAEYPTMPQSAIETGAADFIDTIARLADRIAEVARSKLAIRNLDESEVADGVRRILTLTRTRTGHDFSGYKAATVLRRIKRRVQLCRRTSIDDYATYARNNPSESRLLFADLLISVTSFFRDKDAFELLKRTAVQPLLETAEDDLRVWTVGCASGEEAYSIAILFLEEMERQESKSRVQIFATDLDEDALATARMGIYPRSIEVDVSAERLKRFFIDEDSHYRVCSELRDMVLFATHSVVREPPFTRLDLVVCRNVLIYLERQLQQQVSSIFYYALKSGGYLFLGPAEMPDMSSGSFDMVERDARIYKASPKSTSTQSIMPRLEPNLHLARSDTHRNRSHRAGAGELMGFAHLSALEEHAPPSVLVDEAWCALNLSPTAGRFMLLPGGLPTAKLPAMVRPELRGELMIALDQAFASHGTVATRAVDVVFDHGMRKVMLHVSGLPVAPGTSARALVCFLDGGPSSRIDEGVSPSTPDQEEIRRLRADLSAAQQSAMASRAEHESAVQDLRVANEELQSLNEEYRSTAEELETSKEELQSVNEELHTVNAELRNKVQVVSSAHNDLLNLTTSSEIGTLFLSPDLTIRMFTPPVSALFNISDTDVGRSITDFTHHLVYGDFAKDVRNVLHSLAPIEQEIRGPDGRWLLLRIRPYRTTDDKVSGVVITFTDITDRKREMTSEESEARYKAFVIATADVVFRMSADWSEMLRLEGRDMLADTDEPSRSWMEAYILPEDRPFVQTAIDDAIRDKRPFLLEHRIRRRDGSPGWTRSRAVPILDDAGAIQEWLGTAVDVTMRYASFTALQANEERLKRVVDLVPCMIWQSDPDGTVMFSNYRWSAFTGQSLEQVQDFGWLDAIHPDDAQATRTAFMSTFATGRPLERVHRVRRADGAYRRFLVRLVPHFNEHGTIAHWYGSATDIDERHAFAD